MAINAPIAATSCLYSTLRNPKPVRRFFGFIPPHGRWLDCGEETTVWGDIQHHFTKLTPNNRARRSFELALEAGDIVLVKSPAVHLYDETLDNTKILTIANGSFAAADPCWGAYSSSVVECA